VIAIFTKKNWSLVVLVILCQNLEAQYTVNGNAQQITCNCYTLTQEIINQSGSVWNNNKIDLSQSFDFKFDVNLGRFDANGADGIAFVLQPISTSVGSTGGGLGYSGITPAVGITIDTYQNVNDNDPAYDHIAIQLNGDLNHTSVNNIAGPVTALSGNPNIEDGNIHSLRIQWDAATKTLSTYIDGILRVSAVKDLVTDVFSGNPLVYWGFTGGTGSLVNLQSFCTALTPHFYFSFNQKRCVNEPITFLDSTISFTTIAKFYWDFGDGSPIDSVDLNPTHVYTIAGDYTVIQTVVGADGCPATNTQTVRVGSKPVANFGYSQTCTIMPPIQFTDSSTVAVGTLHTWYWDFDNGSGSSAQNPSTTYPTSGYKNVKLYVTTLEGCESDTLVKPVYIHARPLIDFTFTDSVCLGSPTYFYSQVINSDAPITEWAWIFNDTTMPIHSQNAVHYFIAPGNHIVILEGIIFGRPNCGGFAYKNVFVVNKPIAYFKTNPICQSAQTTLQDSSYTTDGVAITGWWWDLGNGQFSAQQNPTVTYNTTGPVIIKHVVYNSHGCISDTLTQTINLLPKAIAQFGYSNPQCNNTAIQFNDSSFVTGGLINQWNWINNGIVFSTQQNPLQLFPSGIHTIGLVAGSITGCLGDTLFKIFLVNPAPDVSMSFNNACKNILVNFTAVDNSGTVTKWNWTFGDAGIANTKDAQHAYTANGTYNVKLFAVAQTGCSAGPLQKNIIIYGTNVFAGNDTLAAAGQPVQLNASGGLSYTWTPAAGLNDPNIANPIAVIYATQIFTVKAFTPQGCETYDDVTIKIYKGPDIYLPNAFTPNDDGLNDVLRGIPVGISEFKYLKIFNRYGQELFSTTDYRKGWDGRWKGQKQEAGVYVVIASGIDFNGNAINKKGTVILIR
jgi:gliding motility-associated-like protein